MLTYRKGPLGYAVSLNGKPYGRIRDVRQHGGWQVSVPTLNATIAMKEHGMFSGKTVFRTVTEAKKAIEESLK